MLEKWKHSHELADSPRGQRFTKLYERQQAHNTAWLTWVYVVAALICVAIGVVLSFIPGPAFVFFILAGGLLASQSRWAAEHLDRGELALRSLWQRGSGFAWTTSSEWTETLSRPRLVACSRGEKDGQR